VYFYLQASFGSSLDVLYKSFSLFQFQLLGRSHIGWLFINEEQKTERLGRDVFDILPSVPVTYLIFYHPCRSRI